MPLPEDERSTEDAIYDRPSPFNPYDPPEDAESVQPSPSPTPVTTIPGTDGDTSGADGESREAPQGQQEEDGEQPLPEFDPRHREDFVGLLYLGRISQTFPLYGHTFVIRTLTTEQIAEIAQIVHPYKGTHAEHAVYQSAFVAASVDTVDGQSLPGAITFDSTHELTTVKFPYVQKNWMPPVREAIYNRCFRLELLSRKVLGSMGEASG